MASATRSIVFNAPRKRCFEVITDYGRYPEFISSVKAVRTNGRKGNTVNVEYDVQLLMPVSYTVHMNEEPVQRVSWTFVKGEFMRNNAGSWHLAIAPHNQTSATYQVEVELGPLVPKGLVKSLVEVQLPNLLESFKKRIEGR